MLDFCLFFFPFELSVSIFAHGFSSGDLVIIGAFDYSKYSLIFL